MKKWVFSLWIVSILFVFSSCTSKGDKKDDKVFVTNLIKKMSVDEKVAQMRIFHADSGMRLNDHNELILSDLNKSKLANGIAGVKNPGGNISPEKAALLNNQLQKYIIEHNRLHIPALFITESYNGVKGKGCTRFPSPITLASSWNEDLVHRVYECVGSEAHLRGMHMSHFPEADIVRDPRYGRMSESFGEDTYLVTRMIVNAVEGLQGDNINLKTHIGAVLKHFAGYGQLEGGHNFSTTVFTRRTLVDDILPPFKAAVEHGALGVMASHCTIDGVPCHQSEELLSTILRKQWGFDGYVVSDAEDIHRLYTFMNTAASEEDAALLALKAGVDIDLYSNQAYAYLPDLVHKYPELEKYLDKAVEHVLMTKVKMGLFDNPYVDCSDAKMTRDSKAIDLANNADQESIIMLKNTQSTLPLSKGIRTVALVGPTIDKGTLESFKKNYPKIKFIAEKGFELTRSSTSKKADRTNKFSVDLTSKSDTERGINRILSVVRKSDAVILFVGGNSFTCREAFFLDGALGDRADLNLVGAQDELIAKIAKLKKPLIGVLKHHRTLTINELAREADAILDCWELSEFGDSSIAKIIFGDVNPSGKLTVTVPRTVGQIPCYYSQNRINFKKGYLFMDNTPLYPFGFGLSYTTFDYSNLKLNKAVLTDSNNIVASVNVTNTGTYEGKEVVQFYIKDLYAQVVRPEKELKYFQKISLKPGETKVVNFTITPELLKYCGISMEQVIDDGEHTLYVGGNSIDLIAENFMFKTTNND